METPSDWEKKTHPIDPTAYCKARGHTTSGKKHASTHTQNRWYSQSIMASASIIQAHDAATEQSIDQELSTKSRIMLSNWNALLIFVEMSAKVKRRLPQPVILSSNAPFSCGLWMCHESSIDKWWLFHHRRLQMPNFLQTRKKHRELDRNRKPPIQMLVKMWRFFSHQSKFDGGVEKLVQQNAIYPIEIRPASLWSIITWITAVATAMPISQ